MIEKILERLEEQEQYYEVTENCDSLELPQNAYYKGLSKGFGYAIGIVQEVAKEYKAPIRCLTCARYTDTDTIDNICYLCCKGMEDNYVVKESKA